MYSVRPHDWNWPVASSRAPICFARRLISNQEAARRASQLVRATSGAGVASGRQSSAREPLPYPGQTARGCPVILVLIRRWPVKHHSDGIAPGVLRKGLLDLDGLDKADQVVVREAEGAGRVGRLADAPRRHSGVAAPVLESRGRTPAHLATLKWGDGGQQR